MPGVEYERPAVGGASDWAGSAGSAGSSTATSEASSAAVEGTTTMSSTIVVLGVPESSTVWLEVVAAERLAGWATATAAAVIPPATSTAAVAAAVRAGVRRMVGLRG